VTRRGRDRRFEGDHEPDWNAGALQWYGGEPIFAVGCTEGGAPYEVTLEEMRRDSEREARGAGWSRAKHILRELIGRELGTVKDIGRVVKIGEGLSRDIFAAEVELVTGACDSYVVALPRRNALAIFPRALPASFGFSHDCAPIPFHFIAANDGRAFPAGKHLALVRRFTLGVMLDLRAGRQVPCGRGTSSPR
jgi:hypothetical protein